ncbi:hypothetical protein ZWY2020_019235 [Hordeum vulgare]|nr:hypothetical protein ZWY2020_019235 [Hordeum vulgare]
MLREGLLRQQGAVGRWQFKRMVARGLAVKGGRRRQRMTRRGGGRQKQTDGTPDAAAGTGARTPAGYPRRRSGRGPGAQPAVRGRGRGGRDVDPFIGGGGEDRPRVGMSSSIDLVHMVERAHNGVPGSLSCMHSVYPGI